MGYDRSLMYKQRRQDSGQWGVSFVRYSESASHMNAVE